jgi:hypothetical protein
MNELDVVQALSEAAEEFPAGRPPADLRTRVARRRRVVRAGVGRGLVAAAAAVTGIVVVAPSMTGGDNRSSPAAVDSATYTGARWVLTGVTQQGRTTAIPLAMGAGMELRRDGSIVLDNGTNTLTGRFSADRDGFLVQDVGTTFKIYGGDDPARLAAQSGINTLAYGNEQGVTPSGSMRDRVVSVDGGRLVVQAGSVRLEFDRAASSSNP